MSDASKRAYDDVDFGDELPVSMADVSLKTVRVFTAAAGMNFSRFNDHEKARELGLPGAIVPGIMSQGIFAAAIHAWAPGSTITKIDTIFRAPLVADTEVRLRGVVTDRDDEARTVELDLTLHNEADETPVLGTAIVVLD
ncbi:MAG: acyl dehydratase [Myxococcota bacterium]|jgi:acyl dehydratase